jgi:peptidyl-prolyl cis-trans isomerase D
MLNSMRAKKNRTIMYILMGLLIVGLTGFGISSFTGGSLRNIGSVGEEKISIDAYGRQMNQTMQNISRQIGRNLTPAEIESSGIQRAVLAEVVATAGMDNEARRLGLSVGDAAVREELLATPAFKSLAGEFDPEAYRFALERANLSATEYEETLRKQNARGLIQSSIASGIHSDETVAKAFVSFAGETRDIEWVELTADYLTTPVGEPTEEQLVEQYELNPETYTAPLTKDITYVWLSPDSLTDQVEVTEAELREAYEINSERYNRPARRAVDRIVFSSQQEALDARARLDSGLIDFDKLAEDRSLTLEDIDQGEVEQDQLPQAVGDLIFNAAEPGVVGPADTDLGPALYRINAIFDENITPFEEVEDDLREELAAEHTGVMVLNMLPEIDDMLAAGATLEELGAETDMELGSLSYSADVTEGIAAYDEFRIAADAAAEGDFPQIEHLSDGGVFALRVDKVIQPARIPLDEIRDQVAL